MYLPRHFSGNCYIYELSTQYCSTSEISLRACGNTIKDHKDDVHRLRQLLGKNGASVLRSDRKKSTHTFLSITQIWIALVKNHSNQQKVHILRIPNW